MSAKHETVFTEFSSTFSKGTVKRYKEGRDGTLFGQRGYGGQTEPRKCERNAEGGRERRER